MRKINFKSLGVRALVYLLSSALGSFGVGCYYACGLGTDPISVFVDGLHGMFALSYGQISTIFNVIFTICIILFERKHFGLGTIIGCFTSGPLLDVFETLMRTNFPVETTPLPVRAMILCAGLFAFAIGCGLGIACHMGIGCFQFGPIFLSDVTHIDLKYTQIITDAIFFVIGFSLGGVIGVGTLVGVFLTGPILGYTLAKTEKPIEKLGPIFTA